ncbi:DUF456 domain-containing protein [Leptolyngbya sp. O-77]|uniref:DUF456 domain-containing protein n=1 Tax=Leptolyngbya sp. O-77 TaxID=1080068 RepID=UPI00074D3FC0|nr:DUF456 family protein [Leptolyngbya sp. O-77]BAU40727.1 hypothetical protein O77CONTIG1_00531 [Leptolyngbya sp. O-77]
MVYLYWILVAVMLVGVIGSVAPAIPGIGLIALAIAVWGLVNGFTGLGIPLSVAVVCLVVGTGVDFLATYLGAKKAGASKWGQLGAVVGLLLGVFGLLPALPFGGPFLGLLIGPIAGAILGEFLFRKDLWLAIKAGLGIVVGSLIGRLVQFILAIATFAVFLWTTLPTITAAPGVA